MGSAPATEAQVAEYARGWAEVLGEKLEERTQRVRDWLAREQPAHAVSVSPLLMARVPVTRGQWRAVMADVPKEWEQAGDDDLPATHLDWPQSLAFCNALSEREGLTPCYRRDEQDTLT